MNERVRTCFEERESQKLQINGRSYGNLSRIKEKSFVLQKSDEYENCLVCFLQKCNKLHERRNKLHQKCNKLHVDDIVRNVKRYPKEFFNAANHLHPNLQFT